MKSGTFCYKKEMAETNPDLQRAEYLYISAELEEEWIND